MFFSLAVGGQDGVARMLSIIKDELEAAMALCGCQVPKRMHAGELFARSKRQFSPCVPIKVMRVWRYLDGNRTSFERLGSSALGEPPPRLLFRALLQFSTEGVLREVYVFSAYVQTQAVVFLRSCRVPCRPHMQRLQDIKRDLVTDFRRDGSTFQRARL